MAVHPTPRTTAAGTVTWRVQAKNDRGQVRQASFTNEKGAQSFARLVNRAGIDAALEVLARRRAPAQDDDELTLAQWTHRYLAEDQALLTGVTPGTRAEYRRIAERTFLARLGDLPLDAITEQDVARWLVWQAKQPTRTGGVAAEKTLRNRQGLLSSVLAAAVTAGKAKRNAAHKASIPACTTRPKVFLTVAEFDTLMAAMDPGGRPLARWLVGTAMRFGEATAGVWRDLDRRAETPSVHIWRAWKKGTTKVVLGPPKTKKSVRDVEVWAELVAELGTPGRPGAWIFPGARQGKPMRAEYYRRHYWKPALARANDSTWCRARGLDPIGKEPRVHDLRHTAVSWMIAEGVPLPAIQERLGHESIQTTIDVYGSLLPALRHAGAAATARAMSGAPAPRKIPA